MKVLIFGLGSIGSRHASNLRALRPDAIIVGADPVASFSMRNNDWMFTDWRNAIQCNPDAKAAIVASPTEAHLEQAMALRDAGIPFYIEKPIGTVDQITQFGRLNVDRCAVGYQYRYHPVYSEAAPVIRRNRHVRFIANDNLLARYGPDCLSVIAVHPIDTALWLLEPARDVDIDTDGVSVTGTILHERGISEYDCRIDIEPRRSTIASGRVRGKAALDTWNIWSLDPCNEMYLNALSAWLAWVGGAARDERTATLVDGIAALEVMSKVRRT